MPIDLTPKNRLARITIHRPEQMNVMHVAQACKGP